MTDQPIDLDQVCYDLAQCGASDGTAAAGIAEKLIAEVRALRAERDAAEQRWEWGVRLTPLPTATHHKVSDLWQENRKNAETVVANVNGSPPGSWTVTATLLRRLHRILPAEEVEENVMTDPARRDVEQGTTGRGVPLVTCQFSSRPHPLDDECRNVAFLPAEEVEEQP